MKYLVTIDYVVEVDADNETEARVQAGMAMDLSSANFEVEELTDSIMKYSPM